MTQERAATVDGPADDQKKVNSLETKPDINNKEQEAYDEKKKQHKAIDFEAEMKDIAIVLKQKEESDKKDSISKLT